MFIRLLLVTYGFPTDNTVASYAGVFNEALPTPSEASNVKISGNDNIANYSGRYKGQSHNRTRVRCINSIHSNVLTSPLLPGK